MTFPVEHKLVQNISKSGSLYWEDMLTCFNLPLRKFHYIMYKQDNSRHVLCDNGSADPHHENMPI